MNFSPPCSDSLVSNVIEHLLFYFLNSHSNHFYGFPYQVKNFRKVGIPCLQTLLKPVNEFHWNSHGFYSNWCHYALPILFFYANYFWCFPYQLIDFGILFIWGGSHIQPTTPLKPVNSFQCNLRGFFSITKVIVHLFIFFFLSNIRCWWGKKWIF